MSLETHTSERGLDAAALAPDLAIIGAGPAGLSAALTARAAGLSVTLIDDQAEPGGQIWRAAGSVPASRAALLGGEYELGRKVVAGFLACGATYLPNHLVWNIETEPRLSVDCSGPSGGLAITPKTLLLATGAVERPAPAPGWTLPGVMTAGGLQILLKTSGLAADDAVLAGAGPLLWLVAAQMVEAGVPPRALVETVTRRQLLGAARLLPGALRGAGPLFKGLKLIRKVRGAGVPVYRGARDLAIEGADRAEAIRFTHANGRSRRIDTTTVALHIGVAPNQQASRLLRAPHDWSEAQLAFLPRRDAHLAVAPNILMAGDGAGIGGAEAAFLEGKLAAQIVAGESGAETRRALSKARATRPFLDALYRPPQALRQPADETLVCRCEAVTAGAIRQAARDGAIGPNQVKFMLRSGMGPCQGRVCGLLVSELIAEARGQSHDETGYFRIRPPLKPVPLSVIAGGGLPETEDEPVL